MSFDRHRAIETANRLLGNRRRHQVAEGNAQSDVEALFRAMGVGALESHYRLPSGVEADIYLTTQVAITEVKPYPEAEDPDRPQGSNRKTPRQQLEDYIMEMRTTDLRLFRNVSSDRHWTGIVTDGSHWHVYFYPHAMEGEGQKQASRTFLTEGEALVDFLVPFLCAADEPPARQGEPGDLLTDLLGELHVLYDELPPDLRTPAQTKHALWLDMMRASGMVPNDEPSQRRLFVIHSFLIVVVRLVSATLRSLPNDSWDLSIQDGFASWVLGSARGSKWAGKVQAVVAAQNWRGSQGVDVFRDLYDHCVDSNDRRMFGEFYTPDWLAALIVEEALDNAWIASSVQKILDGTPDSVGVLDPACGSGTFLYHAARRILASPIVSSLTPVRQADIVAQLVNGMDIHPVAVEMARVNIERALPAEPTDGKAAIKVFLGDSLRPSLLEGGLLPQSDPERVILETPNGSRVDIPISLVRDTSFAEKMRQIVNAAADKQPLPSGIAGSDNRQELNTLRDELQEVIADEGNSVWTWYATNLVGPYLLCQQKIDRIVANPPWVKLSDIQDKGRKRMMEEWGKQLELQAGGKQAPHLDIASFFILRARKLYMANPEENPAIWLVKRSAIHSGHWEPLRKKHRGILAQSIDLKDLQPFGNGDATRCCLLMEKQALSDIKAPYAQASLHHKRIRPARSDTLDQAKKTFHFTEAPAPLPHGPSEYAGKFKEGAKVVPHVLALIDSQQMDNRTGQVRVTTRRSKHPPWKNIAPQKGLVPRAWIRHLHTSADMLPYVAIRNPPQAIIPTHQGKMHPTPEDACPFWQELEEIYARYRGKGKSTPKNLLAQFDYHRTLAPQIFEPQTERCMVLYPSSGDIMRAARTPAGMATVDSGLHWMLAGSEAEAGYLVALLNASCLRRAFAQSKTSGRHFCLNPWRKIPVPLYDKKQSAHRSLAELCGSVEKIAEQAVQAMLQKKPDLKQVALSEAVRRAVYNSAEGRKIEALAGKILPHQAS